MTFDPRLAFLAFAASLACVAPALAQQQPLSLPPPPSMTDGSSAPAAKPARRQPRKKTTRAPQPSSREPRDVTLSSPSTGYSDKVDMRGGRGMELEDDPRGVQPTMQNGRAGMGMRF